MGLSSDTKVGRKQRMGDLEVECGGSSVDRVMVSIKEDSNVHNNLHIRLIATAGAIAVIT
jgi:hypothetical protein